MLRERILDVLSEESSGISLEAIAEKINYPGDASSLGTIEIFLMLSPEVTREGLKWKVAGQKSRSSRLLAAIESYADSTGKKIFRLSHALTNIPVHEHPTEEELNQILSATNGRYQLMKNAMIKRNS